MVDNKSENEKFINKINEEFICILKKNISTQEIEINYTYINKLLTTSIEKLSYLCQKIDIKVEEIIDFLKENEELNQLNNFYRYCDKLDGKYQSFTANKEDYLKNILNQLNFIYFNYSSPKDKKKKDEKIKDLKNEIEKMFIRWQKAYSINACYNTCIKDNDILSFSHRISGWSNPIYHLTKYFSLKFQTNFGYGKSSYFFLVLKYKNILITPFSEWIEYDVADFSEIVRYTQKYILENKSWLEAMEYAKEACNISINQETKFVKKYIIEECEKMVNGLEKILFAKEINVKDKDDEKIKINKKGEALIDFRAEKISGALDFVSKLYELENIICVDDYIKRIENCNIKLKPYLINEIERLPIKIYDLKCERDFLEKELMYLYESKGYYDNMYNELKNYMINKGKLNNDNLDHALLNAKFYDSFPKYGSFIKKFHDVNNQCNILNDLITKYLHTLHNYKNYINKITSYFNLKTVR